MDSDKTDNPGFQLFRTIYISGNETFKHIRDEDGRWRNIYRIRLLLHGDVHTGPPFDI